jgi:hypothetical protein
MMVIVNAVVQVMAWLVWRCRDIVVMMALVTNPGPR